MSGKEEDFNRRREIVRSLNVMDDDLFTKVAEDVPAMEEILSVLSQDPELRLLWSKSQVHIRNCGTRSVTLDAMCESVSGTLYSVEMEKSNRDDHQRRVRYNSSNIDTMYTEKGLDFKEIPNLCMIYLSKADFLRGGKCLYHIDRTVRGSAQVVENGVKEIYVNARVNDGSKVAQLMQYMKNTRGENPLFPKLSARVRYLKEEQKGVEQMCEAVEKYAQEKAEEAAKEAAKEVAKSSAILLFQNGVSFEVVAKSIKQLTRKELEKIYQAAH
ncbi:MAG: hypothetical protein J1E03_00605 [Acetatifactor sp.]|nr:hypothetical protein [Acetatifactor sp.]